MKRDIQVEFLVTPEEVAEALWDMDGDGQASFFNALASAAGPKLIFQLQYVADSECLSEYGRQAMRQIGDYGSAKP